MARQDLSRMVDIPLPLREPLARACHFGAQAQTSNTRRAYRSDWTAFEAWCRNHAITAFPAPETLVAVYLADMADQLATSSLERRLVAIAARHREAQRSFDMGHILLRKVMAGIRREKGIRRRRKAALGLEQLAPVVHRIEDTPRGRRDSALLLTGYFAAARRSELSALGVNDLEFRPEGIILTLRRSKTDPVSGGFRKALPRQPEAALCPVTAIERWLAVAPTASGPLFRAIDRHGHVAMTAMNGDSIRIIVKQRLGDWLRGRGLSDRQVAETLRDYSAHSLRAGFITDRAVAGATLWQIRRHTGHKRKEAIEDYIRLANIFAEFPAT